MAAIAALYEAPGIRVARVTSSRQRGRRFAHLRLEVADIRQLPASPMFSWATIGFDRTGELYRYREDVGPSANKPVGDVGWKGNELIGYRLHLPSKIAYHNAGKDNLLRGNILAWEQTLTDRLAGVPLQMEEDGADLHPLLHALAVPRQHGCRLHGPRADGLVGREAGQGPGRAPSGR